MHSPAPLLQCQLLGQPSNIKVPQASPKAIFGSQQISTGPGMTAVLSLFTHSLWCHWTKAPTSAFWQPPTSPPWATATHHRKGKEALLAWSSQQQLEQCSSVHGWRVFIRQTVTLVRDFQVCFDVGYDGPHMVTQFANLKSALELQHIIDNKIKKELTLQRIAGTFASPPFPICTFLLWEWFKRSNMAHIG